MIPAAVPNAVAGRGNRCVSAQWGRPERVTRQMDKAASSPRLPACTTTAENGQPPYLRVKRAWSAPQVEALSVHPNTHPLRGVAADAAETSLGGPAYLVYGFLSYPL